MNALRFTLALCLCVRLSQAQNHAPPAWAKDVVWYEIFVERFANGDPANDPRPENMGGPGVVPAGWAVTPWTRDWYAREPWAVQAGLDAKWEKLFRRYGGDLQGVLDKLDYLQGLGVTALYLSPVNDSPSLHKYDARNYHHVDVNLGPDPVGDVRIIAAEKPDDPATWQWTAADRLYLKLVAEVHRRGMRLVQDYSWNHTGTEFWAWQDILKKQAQSPYKDWYAVTAFDDPATPANEFAYTGWAGVSSMPEIKKVDMPAPRVSGFPYEGNIQLAAKAHILAVTRRWLAPDGDVSKGVDGYRMDVANQIPMGFWREYNRYVKGINPHAYLVGEIWWQKWPGSLMNPAPYVGDAGVFDAVMFYQLYRPARAFFAPRTADHLDAAQLRDSLLLQWNRLPVPTRQAMMNVASTPDAPRLLSDFYNTNVYKVKANAYDDPVYRTGKPDAEAYKRLRLYLLHQFTTVGAPHIYYGEELGMWGGDDPDDRKPMCWPGLAFEPETRTNIQPGPKTYDPVAPDTAHRAYYRRLAALRHAYPVLRTGEIEFLTARGNLLAYRRFDPKQPKSQIVVLFNLEPTPQAFDLPAGTAWVDLLTQKGAPGKRVTLSPLSGMVLGQKAG